MFQSRRLNQKIRGPSKKNVFGRTFPANFPKFILLISGLLKMSQGQQLPDPEPELINAKSLDFAKPKLFFKNIGRYAATSTYIHVRIPFNFSKILDTKITIEQQYQVLLDKHEDPFKTIAKTTTDVSLLTISGSIEDFQDVIKALPQTTEIDLPGRPKRFIALGIAIAAAALSSYNAYKITELNNEISTLKSKTDLLVDVSHLHEDHLHHLEDKTDKTNELLADLLESNVWFTAKITDAVEKKFQSVVHHHENVVKSAQHHRLAPGALPHDVLDEILNHTLAVAKKRNMVSFVNYASDLFQVEVSHLYDPKTMQFTLIVHIPLVSNTNLLELYEFLPLPIHFNFSANISITPDVGQNNLLAIGHSKSFQTISSSDLHSCLHLGDTFFCKGRKVMETSLKKSCLGSLYLANSEAIQNSCKFKIAEASEKIFELAENTWAVYSTGTINTNQVCQARNSIQTRQINSGDTVTLEPGCYIRTMDHVISADESETIEIQRKTMDWAGEIADLFGRANTEGIHKAIQGLRTKYNGEFDASELFKELDQIKPAEAHWTFTSPAAMIGIALALFLIGMLIWKKCFSTTQATEASLPAPSAPPMPAQNRPQPQRAQPVTNNQATKSNASIPIHINIS
jgi:hypothetical protein